jgi:hypothetical protein
MYKNYVILIYNVHELQFTFSFIFHLLIVPTEIWPIRNIYTCSNILLIINLPSIIVVGMLNASYIFKENSLKLCMLAYCHMENGIWSLHHFDQTIFEGVIVLFWSWRFYQNICIHLFASTQKKVECINFLMKYVKKGL